MILIFKLPDITYQGYATKITENNLDNGTNA